MLERVVDIFVGEMKVAAEMQTQAAGEATFQFGEQFAVALGKKGELIVGMGGSGEIGGAVGGGCERHFDILGAVIEAGQEMAVDISAAGLRGRGGGLGRICQHADCSLASRFRRPTQNLKRPQTKPPVELRLASASRLFNAQSGPLIFR